MDHGRLLALGLIVLLAADLLLAANERWPTILAGVFLWAAHMGITHGLFARMIADSAPVDLRDTAYGAFKLVGGHRHAAGQCRRGAAVGPLRCILHLLCAGGFTELALVGLILKVWQQQRPSGVI